MLGQYERCCMPAAGSSGRQALSEATAGIKQGCKARRRHARSLHVRTKAALGEEVASASRALTSSLERLGDEQFWRAQPPHFGTQAASQLASRLQGLLAEGLQALPLPRAGLPAAWTGESLQLRWQELSRAAAASADSARAALASAAAAPGGAIIGGGSGANPAPSPFAGLPPHFGTRAAASATRSLADSVAAAASQLGLPDPGRALDLGPILAPLHGLASAPAAAAAALAAWQPQSTLAEAAGAAAAYAASLQESGLGGYSPSTVTLLAVGIVSIALVSGDRGPAYEIVQQAEQLPWDWDAAEVAAYWRRRPVAVAARAAQVLAAAASVAMALGFDYARGLLPANAQRRAAQVRGEIERLGPAYVKIAQAVSTRVDILSPPYLVEIERLQDRVPQFPTELALASMEAAWGRPASEVFVSMTPAPIAAASLGQVYRGTLASSYGGTEVAVKVQRPNVRGSVGLDLYLMRSLAVLLRRAPKVKSDWVGLIDEWAGRFFQELDYEREAASAAIFQAQMADLPGVTTPDVLPALSSHTVLTSAWVEGEKLSESSASDVRQLCTTLLNCYLIQLLETGLLHADPHPGNLIRTPDGRICILDFGLMTEVPPERAQALVEYIAHLSVEDFEAVVMHDLPALGFIPPGAPDPVASGLVAPLGSILRQLSAGGGASSINIDDITIELEKLTRDYPFQVPAYFALILRAFSVIEGIALRVDPSYSIVKECFPYIARRLLTDNHPRTRLALHQLLYADGTRVSIARLQRLTRGFGAFSVAGLQPVPGAGSRPLSEAPAVVSESAREALKLVLSAEGSYLQEVLVNELVATVSSLQRLALSRFARRVLDSPPAALANSAVAALGPWRPLFLPLPTPLELLSQLAPAVEPDAEDAEALALLAEAAALLREVPAAGPTGARGNSALAALRELAPLLPELAPGLGATGELFVRTLVQRSAMRLAKDVAPARSHAVASARDSPAATHSVGRKAGTVAGGNGRVGPPVNGVARPSVNGYSGPVGSDGMAPEPAITAIGRTPRAGSVLDSLKKDQREGRSLAGRM